MIYKLLIYLIVSREKRIYYLIEGVDHFIESFFLFKHPFREYSLEFEHLLFNLLACLLE